MEPIRTTLGYGQVNTMLMALVVADLLPRRGRGRAAPDPAGSLIGLAAAIKLTPALFVVFAFLIGKRRAALTAIVSFVGFTAARRDLPVFADRRLLAGLAGGDTRTAAPLYAGQPVAARRLLPARRLLAAATTLIGLGFAAVVALLGALVAAQWWQAGRRCSRWPWSGCATCLASPLSWTHHYVWILPMGAARPAGPRAAALGPARGWRLGGLGVACLPLAVLPYGCGRERNYTVLQQVVANLGPLLGVALIIGLAGRLVSRAQSPRRGRVAVGVD